MTCVAGLVWRDSVLIAADGYGVEDGEVSDRGDGKVFFVGPHLLIGFCGSYRVGQVIRYHFSPPVDLPEKAWCGHESLVRHIVPALRQCLRDHGCVKGDAEEMSANLIVGYAGALYRIEADFNVAQTRREYDAIGCGGPYALGALHASRGADPRARIYGAIRAAEAHCAGVGGENTLLILGPPVP